KYASHPLHERIHHALFAGLVEGDGELVAVDGGDVAVAEFLVKDALADGESGAGAGRFGDELAFDHQRAALLCATRADPAGFAGQDIRPAVVLPRSVPRRARLVEAAHPPAALRALPAGRRVARAESGHLVEAAGAVARHAEAAGTARRLRHLDIFRRQLVEKA